MAVVGLCREFFKYSWIFLKSPNFNGEWINEQCSIRIYGSHSQNTTLPSLILPFTFWRPINIAICPFKALLRRYVPCWDIKIPHTHCPLAPACSQVWRLCMPHAQQSWTMKQQMQRGAVQAPGCLIRAPTTRWRVRGRVPQVHKSPKLFAALERILSGVSSTDDIKGIDETMWVIDVLCIVYMKWPLNSPTPHPISG